MIFGQSLLGADPVDSESLNRTQRQPFMLSQSGILADIKFWSVRQEWVEECVCPGSWETVEDKLDIVRCEDGC